MKRIPLLSIAALLLAGLFLLLPWHMEFTGYVLILLGVGGILRRCLRKKWKTALTCAMITCSVLLAAAMAAVALVGIRTVPLPQSDYAVILGAQTVGDQPAPVLRERLDAGLAYMRENPDVPVILTGGQGPDEAAAEAEIMEAYLLAQGADGARLFTENHSSVTAENLENARLLAESLGITGNRITIITSEFHLPRALYLAQKQGFMVGGVPSVTEQKFYFVNYCLREVFAFVKAFFA